MFLSYSFLSHIQSLVFPIFHHYAGPIKHLKATKHRLPQLPGQMSIIQALKPRGESGDLNINANGQSVQGGCTSSTVSPSKADEIQALEIRLHNSSQNTESREASHITDDSNCSATSLQQKVLPCLSDVAYGSLGDFKVVAAPTVVVCESPPFFLYWDS